MVFDTLEYSRAAQAAGFSREQAEFQAFEMARMLNETLVSREILKQELFSLESKIRSFQYKAVWTILGGMTTLLSLFQSLIKHTGG